MQLVSGGMFSSGKGRHIGLTRAPVEKTPISDFKRYYESVDVGVRFLSLVSVSPAVDDGQLSNCVEKQHVSPTGKQRYT